jgi:hypothetical protein
MGDPAARVADERLTTPASMYRLQPDCRQKKRALAAMARTFLAVGVSGPYAV